MNHYDDDTMTNTAASTPPTKSKMRIDELLDRLLIDTIPSPPDLSLGETQPAKPTTTTTSSSSSSINPSHMNMFANQMNDILSEGGTKIKPASSSTNSDKTDYYKEMKGAFEQYEIQAKRTDNKKSMIVLKRLYSKNNVGHYCNVRRNGSYRRVRRLKWQR